MSKCLNFRNHAYSLKEGGGRLGMAPGRVSGSLCSCRPRPAEINWTWTWGASRPRFPRASFFSFRIGSRIKVFLLSPTYFKENWPLSTWSHFLLKRFNKNLKVMKTYSALEIYGLETQHILPENRHECFQGWNLI